MTRNALYRLVIAVAVVLSIFASRPAFAAADDKFEPFERWFSVLMDGKPAGWMHLSVSQAKPGGPIVSKQSMKMSIRRGQTAITILTSTSFQETPDGKPIAASSEQTLGALAIKTSVKFEADGMKLTSSQGGVERQQTLPLPEEDWLPPYAAGRDVQRQVEAGKKQVTMRTMDMSMGPKVVEMVRTFKGKEKIELLGKTVEAQHWVSTITGMPIQMKEYTDEKGELLRSTMSVMGMNMTMVAADESIAKAEINPPELLARTFIKPDKPIKRPRKSRMAIYELTLTPNGDDKGKFKQDESLASTGYQRVVWGDERTARVVVDLSNPVAPGNDAPKDKHRQASSTVNTDDPAVKDLLKKAMSDEAARKAVAKAFKEKDPSKLSKAAQAELLRRFVHEFIDAKSLEVGFATASEVARTAKGDCTEHGVLLAALLRAADIPSRTVTGLIYVDEFAGAEGIFGYHMWTQAWLPVGPADVGATPRGGRWVDLDATLPKNTPYDAAHITLATSALEEGAMTNDMVKMVGVIGRLKVKVIDVTNE